MRALTDTQNHIIAINMEIRDRYFMLDTYQFLCNESFNFMCKGVRYAQNPKNDN
jgi:hypothetical protein